MKFAPFVTLVRYATTNVKGKISLLMNEHSVESYDARLAGAQSSEILGSFWDLQNGSDFSLKKD